ncbi:phasin family protein [Methylobacterium nigriterrae]|uniref:phasin family protein n=1 Tax=Methylobacterium nigriterrae TaxID=3127512 RepID=UPI0030141422
MAGAQTNPKGDHDERVTNIASAARSNTSKAAEQGQQLLEAGSDGIYRIIDLQERTTENARQVLQSGIETASHQIRQLSGRFVHVLGFSNEDTERLASQSKQNLEAVSRGGTVLTQAFQDASRRWFDLSQKQWQRNLDGLNRLARAKSVQEFAAIQSELIREGLQHVVSDSRAIAERSLRAVDEAGKALTNTA